VELVDRFFSPLAAFGLIAAAIAGFLIGSHRAGVSTPSPAAATVSQRQQLTASRVVLEAPATWHTVRAATAVPGLALAPVQAVAPPGEPASQLLIGTAPAGSTSPLPAGLVARLGGRPVAEVVQLPQAEALRYADVSVSGYAGLLTLYALPVPGEGTTVIACEAPSHASAFIRSCEEAAATVRPIGQQAAINLTPDAAYGQQVSAILAALERQRTALRAQLRQAPGSSTAPAARALAAAFTRAAASLSQLEAPAPASGAHGALATSMLAEAHAYTTLAADVGQTAAYEAARTQVQTAEVGTDSALAAFGLVGYKLGG
jgi:hypothetical protein